MVQIKLSVAFVLAAAAISPVVAQPIREGQSTREGHESFDDVDHYRHHHHHHHPHTHPEHLLTEPTFDATRSPSRHEHADEFVVRDFLNDMNYLTSLENKEKTLLRKDALLANKHKSLESENSHLQHQDKQLERKGKYLENKNHRLEREDGKLKRKHRTLEWEDKSLEDKKHRLVGDDQKLGSKRKSLEAQDKSLTGKNRALERKNKALAKKDRKLSAKGELLGKNDVKLALKGKALANKNKLLMKDLARKDKALAQEGTVLAHNDKVLAQKGNLLVAHAPVVHSKVPVVAREYAEFDDIFEREFENAGSGDASTPHFRRPLFLGPGPAIPSYRGRHRSSYGLRPKIYRRPSQRVRFGLGPEMISRRVPTPPKYVVREYAELEDMVERDFEDVDARDYDDELHLD